MRKENVKSILFCSPHNPSGRVWREEELSRLVSICKKYNILLIADEVHSDLVLNEGEFISLSSYSDKYDNIIISTSPNKSFNLAGLNASYLLILNKDNKKSVEDEFSKNKLGLNRVGAKFLSNCYSLGGVWVKELRKNIIENNNLAIDILKDCNLKIIKPKAGYLLWIKLDKVDDVQDFVLDLARETGVLLEPGNRFIENYEGYVRVNVATSKAILKEGMERFKDYYNRL